MDGLDDMNLVDEIRGVRGAVWFGFEVKSHLNRNVKNMRFGLVWLTFKIKSEPNQTKLMRFGLDRLVRFFRDNKFFISNIKIRLKR